MRGLRLRKQPVTKIEGVSKVLDSRPLEQAPSIISDTLSVESCSVGESAWRQPYEPPPVVSQSIVLAIGFFLFILASLWPPLILLVAYVASKLIPYSFRINDDASRRRQLFQEFSNDDEFPETLKQFPSHLCLEESYWINSRYVP